MKVFLHDCVDIVESVRGISEIFMDGNRKLKSTWVIFAFLLRVRKESS